MQSSPRHAVATPTWLWKNPATHVPATQVHSLTDFIFLLTRFAATHDASAVHFLVPTRMRCVHRSRYAGPTEIGTTGLDKSQELWNNMCTLIHEIANMKYDTCSFKQEGAFMAYYACLFCCLSRAYRSEFEEMM